ncbi:MAG: hypothetical protein M0C28_22260 [Candidatus Moduliflexus flocculans]|nr:hypothetical protein [Candidatus Moduliflexus flocculans]
MSTAGLSDKVRITCCDIRDYSGPKVDVVVTNPPYRPLKTGRINPDRSKAIARHEISLDLDVLLKKTYELLRPLGRLYIVYPAWRVPDLLVCHAVEKDRAETHEMRVYIPGKRHAEICLVCGVQGGGKEFSIESPLIIYNRRQHIPPGHGDGISEPRLTEKAIDLNI